MRVVFGLLKQDPMSDGVFIGKAPTQMPLSMSLSGIRIIQSFTAEMKLKRI